MKEMIKKVREERGGFTLAELLIVVAIILVLVAIAIPVFTGALNNANTATAEANIRAVKAEASTDYLLSGSVATGDVYYTADIDVDGNISNLTGPSDSGTPTTADDYPFDGGTITVLINAEDLSS